MAFWEDRNYAVRSIHVSRAYQLWEWLERAMRSLRTVEPFCMKLVGWLCPYKPLQRQRVHTEVIIPPPLWFLVDLIIGYIFETISFTSFMPLNLKHYVASISPKSFLNSFWQTLPVVSIRHRTYISREHQQRLCTRPSHLPPLVFSCPCLLNGCFLLHNFATHFYYILSCFLGGLLDYNWHHIFAYAICVGLLQLTFHPNYYTFHLHDN